MHRVPQAQGDPKMKQITNIFHFKYLVPTCQSDMDVNPPSVAALSTDSHHIPFRSCDFIGNMRYVVPYTLKWN